MLVLAFAVVASCVLALSLSGPWSERPHWCLGLALAAGAGWLAALACARAAEPSQRALVAGAVLLRVIALAAHLDLSDDVYRYVWEGELVLRGISPYALAPADPGLSAVRAQLPELAALVAHTELPAVYPPLVQYTGALAAGTAHVLDVPLETGGVFALRLGFALADLLVLVPLAHLLARKKRPPGALVAWAFCPLPVLEFAGSGHFDSLGILLLLAVLVLLARADLRTGTGRASTRPECLAAGLLSLAVLVKYLPLLVVPWLGNARRVLITCALFATIAVLAFAPFVAFDHGDLRLGGGLVAYGLRWESSSLVFRFVAGACVHFLEPRADWLDPQRVARVVVGLAWLAFAAVVVARVRDRERGVGLLIAGFLVLTPTLHPWYLTWIVPFIALRPARAFAWLVAVAPLLYAPLDVWQRDGRWIEPAWLWPIFALPFGALILWPFAVRASTLDSSRHA